MDSKAQVYLIRHGETPWTVSRRHTGLTDLPLTCSGEDDARYLARRLESVSFSKAISSPLQRARRTCELAGFAASMTIDPNLVEWNYGEYEGKTTAEIREQRPGWEVFRDGCPGGESVGDVASRADYAITRIWEVDGNVILFSHGHFLRVLAARWLGFDPILGNGLLLSTSSVSILGYEHGLHDPAIRLWNDCRND